MNDLENQKAQYNFFGEHINGFKSEYSLKDFMEAHKAVSSRCFEQPELGIWLTPFGDLLNHQNPPHLVWRYYENDEGRKGWIARAKQDIEKGVQVYTSYGKTPSQYMFPTYGFLPVIEGEEYEVFLEFKTKKDELRDLKSNLLGGKTVNLQMKKIPTQEQLSILRVATYSYTENSAPLKSLIGKSINTRPFSIESEFAALKKLEQICMKNLLAYPRTLLGDKELLERDDLTLNQRNAATFTMKEKETLHALIDFSNWAADLLMQTPNEAIWLIENEHSGMKPEWQNYLDVDLLPLLKSVHH